MLYFTLLPYILMYIYNTYMYLDKRVSKVSQQRWRHIVHTLRTEWEKDDNILCTLDVQTVSVIDQLNLSSFPIDIHSSKINERLMFQKEKAYTQKWDSEHPSYSHIMNFKDFEIVANLLCFHWCIDIFFMFIFLYALNMYPTHLSVITF